MDHSGYREHLFWHDVFAIRGLCQHLPVAGPCLQYVLAPAVHLLFLFSLLVVAVWKKFRVPKCSTLGSPIDQPITAGPLYSATLAACVLLCLGHFLTTPWSLHHGSGNGCNQVLLLASSGFVQAVAWLLMSAATVSTKATKRTTFPHLLRAWWIVSFFLAVSSLFSKYILEGRHGRTQLDTWFDIIALPLSTFLCIVAVYGRTGLSLVALHDLHQPLLNVCSDKPGVAEKRVTHYGTAGFWSLLTFSWLDPLVKVGYQKPLEIDDIPQLAQLDQASSVFQIIKAAWDKIESKSLWRCLIMSFWKRAALNACFAGTNVCAAYVGPYLIDDFVEYIGGRRRFANEGYILASVFFVAKFVETLAQRHYYFGAQTLGLYVTEGLSALIYRKGLMLSNLSRQNHTSGEIINYVSVDVQRVSDFSWYLNQLWLLPFQLCLALGILYKNVGIAALAALAATALTMLLNLPLSATLKKSQNYIMEWKDKRMRATTEVLRSMRILKLQAWELRYLKKIEDLRKAECGWLSKFLYTQAAVAALFWSTPVVVAVFTFGTCVLVGIPLTAGRVLSALATFRVLQNPIYGIPDLVTMLAQTKVSLDRIQSFLKEKELDAHAVDQVPTKDGDVAVEINDACFSWDGSPEKATITISQLVIHKGMKVAICGEVGSGKSSLISCILGEIPKLSGYVKVSGSRAYVAQSAWIQTATIQDNILFGKPMDTEEYDKVLRACTLEKDLEIFAHGDQTEIGERGVNLSGGQKQRLQLARALYQDADIYLLDDPFSAVDAHTGSHLFKECVLNALGSKTVLFVTHQVEFLPAVDLILVLEDGKIAQAGKFDDILLAGRSFSRLIDAYTKSLGSIDLTRTGDVLDKSSETTDKHDLEPRDNSTLAQEMDGKTNDHKSGRQIIQEEERETGRVSAAVYWSFLTAVYKGYLFPIILLVQAFFQSLQISSNYWMAWATPVSFEKNPRFSSRVVFLVFIGLGASSALCIFARTFLLAMAVIKTSQKFFTDMLHSVFHAPMSFFDSTPAGRILNRASTDQSALDLEVYSRLAGLGISIIQLIGIIAVMSQVAWPVFFLFVPVMALSIWLQRYYIESARELARLVGIRKSPIIHHFEESIFGAATIRGFDQESRFMDMNLQLIDCYARPLFHNFAAMEWLCLRLNVLGNIVFGLALLLVVSLPEGIIDPSIAGLAATYGLTLSYCQYLVVWNLCNLENKIISVERIQQYIHIPSEAPLIIEKFRPPLSWPYEGNITLQNLQVRYNAHMPLVLRGITCTFLGGKKIGVVGRTGSGKSTLIQALFRTVEPTAGKILIDGIDTSKIGLHDLRTKLSIIPQDPTMFEGTIRQNLDPLAEHTDAEIWEALDKSQLGPIIRAKEGKLETSVSENGENWSVGQRQLVCLGRALLKRTKILVLDEATASVDTATDAVIQDTIRSEFPDCTVITIAHRIPTVIDNDWVLLLSEGRVAEYDTPARLLQDRSSLFSKLVFEYTTRSGKHSC